MTWRGALTMDEIELRDVKGCRAAFLARWNMPVWSVVAGFEEFGCDVQRAAQRLRLPVSAVRLALYYAARHGNEIDAALREHPESRTRFAPRTWSQLQIADDLAAEAKSGAKGTEPRHPVASRRLQNGRESDTIRVVKNDGWRT
jgi:hypothetical protein